GYDPVARRWPDWIAALLAPRLLPRVVAPGTDIGPLGESLRRDLGLRGPVRIVAGTTDSTAAFLATGARQPGEAVTSLGSTLVVKVLAERPVNAPEFGVYSHRLGDLWLAGGASNSGGAALLRHFSPDRLQELSARLHPERPTGLDYYPLCGPGERFPRNDPDLPPRLTPRPHDPVEFLQGMLEGIARIEAHGYRLLERLGAPYPSSVRTAGGGAVNTAWTAIRARLLGVPMLASEHTDAAYGAAVLARAAVRGGPFHVSASITQRPQ
ncbi:MAG TPA: carbohydrate kinase, partial [Alphaproteobacteria bacterium]|nr:carbohydrate kinase [Alphaproteobacteria bacterium]